MSPSLWLAGRELAVRWRRVALAAAVVAAIAGASTATELVARAREEAVAVQIDAAGPALTLVPRGVTAGALARAQLGEGVLPAGVDAAIAGALGSDLRAVEGRLVISREVAGRPAPVIGVLEGAPSAPDRVLLGSELARRLGPVAAVTVAGQTLGVEGVLPSTGSAEDVGVVVPLASAQAIAGVAGVNALRIYLRAGVSPQAAEARLTAAALPAAVVRADRGEVADGDSQAALARHRGAAHAVMAVVAALCLLIAAHLDASERRLEIATLVAMGASRATVVGALVARSALVAAAGALAGIALGAALAAAQDPTVAAALWRAAPVAAVTFAAALGIGIAAAAPTALACAVRDPVPELQEG